MSQIKIDRSAVISYDKKDPRYNLTIEDSDEYIKNIYPLHFKKKCIKDYDIKYDFPLLYRCWGERYENCSILQKHIETGYCNCAECAMTLYETIPDTNYHHHDYFMLPDGELRDIALLILRLRNAEGEF